MKHTAIQFIKKNRLELIVGSLYNGFMDDFNKTKFLQVYGMFEERYGKPIGEGRHRIVFFDSENDEVVKLPTKMSGDFANYQELREEASYLAKTRLDEELTEILGLAVIRMEFVKHRGWDDKTDDWWAKYIDGGQIGYTKDGRLVAYDWDRF